MFNNYPVLKYSIIIVIIITIAFFLSKVLKKIIQSYFENSSKKLNNDYTNYNFIKHAVSFLVYIAAVIIIFLTIPQMKALGVTLFASAGIFTAILAMASSHAFSNIISGIFIVIFKPFRVEDRIQIGDLHAGIVEDITLRHTIIKNFENQRIIIPNSIISTQTIVNMNIVDEKVCNFFEIPIPYNCNIDQIKQIVIEEATNHPNFLDNRNEEEKENNTPPIIARIISYQNSMAMLRANIWTKNTPDGFVLKCDIREMLLKKFKELEIENMTQQKIHISQQ